jgi:hypothetical protein
MVSLVSLLRPIRTALNILLCSLLLLGVVMSAQNDPTGARELAAKISGVSGRLELGRVTVRDAARGAASETDEFQHALETELRRLGFGFVQDVTAGATLEVTFSDSLQGILIVAEIRSGDTKFTAMLLRPREPMGSQVERTPLVTLQLQPLAMQGEAILDVLPIDDALLLLGTDSLVFQRTAGADPFRHLAAVAHSQPWPRDPRGRVTSDGASVQVYLPGTRCQGTLRPLVLSCAEDSGNWPLDGMEATLVAGRNYFEAEGFRPFYSVARLGPPESPRRLVAGIDGKSYLYNSNRESIAVIDGLGSDLASLPSACGSGMQILSAMPGEEGHSDSLQAFEWIGGRATPSCAPMPMSGSITALRPVASGPSAVVVVHNSKAGRYEAYRVTTACSR